MFVAVSFLISVFDWPWLYVLLTVSNSENQIIHLTKYHIALKKEQQAIQFYELFSNWVAKFL